MPNITDYRDAFILWILADLNLLVAGGLISHAPNYPTPIAAAMIATAVTGYTAAVGLMVLSALSIVAGYRKAGGDNA